MPNTLPRRDEVAIESTWDLDSMFLSTDAWEAAYKQLEAELPRLAAYKGRLTESAHTLYEYLHLTDSLGPELHKLGNYAFLGFDVDTTNQVNAERLFIVVAKPLSADEASQAKGKPNRVDFSMK